MPNFELLLAMNKLFLLAALACMSLSARAQISQYSTVPTQRVYNTSPPASSGLSPQNELLRQRLEAAQNQYDREGTACIQQTKEYYAASEHPASISSGWHDATVTCEALNSCSKLRYYVDGAGKLTNIQQADGAYGPEITTGTKVIAGKAMYTRTSETTGQLIYYTVYLQ